MMIVKGLLWEKKRFFDDRLKYLSFIQNTSEKRAISEQLAPHIASMATK